MTKQKTAKIDLGGQKVEVGISKDLLADLGGMVYFGALGRTAKDRGNDEVVVYSGATMVDSLVTRAFRVGSAT